MRGMAVVMRRSGGVETRKCGGDGGEVHAYASASGGATGAAYLSTGTST